MKRERQIEELAKLDEFKRIGEYELKHGDSPVALKGGHPRLIPDYLNSHDALQPIINGLFDSAQQAYDYHDIITELCSDDCLYVHTAAPAQKAEAILRAVGRWEEK